MSTYMWLLYFIKYHANSPKTLFNYTPYWQEGGWSNYPEYPFNHMGINCPYYLPQGGLSKPRRWDERHVKAQSIYFHPVLVPLFNHMSINPNPHLSQYKHTHSPEYVSQSGAKTVDGQNKLHSALSSQ